MTQLTINTGTTPNDKSADSLYSAFNKVNANFTELYYLASLHLADELTGTIPAEVLANSTVYIGTTPIALNRESGELLLSGVSVDGYSSSLKSATTTIDISNAAQPTDGQVLTATSSTSAEWRTPSSTSIGDEPPASPNLGDLWYDSDGGRLYIFYSNVWVDTNPESASS
jgi:PHP family Zn ribbon phosphoesterase